MIEIKPANQKDIETYYEGRPPFSMQGVVVLEDGVPIAVAGIFLSGGRCVAFSETKVDPKKYKRWAIKVIREVEKVIDGRMIYAVAGNDDTAPGLLTHLGFELVDENEKLYRRG